MSFRRRSAAVPPALIVAFGAFVLFGLTDGVFGTVWPTQRADLTRAVGDLGWLVSTYTVGALAATTASGHITARWGTSRGLVTAATAMTLGLFGIGAAPGFWELAAAMAIFGAGAGLLDSVVNAWATIRHGTRVMGFLHAFFGIGGVLGPLTAAAMLGLGRSWRAVFVAIGIVQVVALVTIWLRRSDYDAEIQREAVSAAGEGHATAGRLLGLTLAWFFLTVGVEASIASWSFSLLVEERGLADTPAAVWVAAFWGTFTLARVVMGLAGERLPLTRTLYGAVALTLIGSLLLWLDPGALPGGIALPLLGLGVSLLFPIMVLITPQWLGAARTGRAVGYQLSASSMGAVGFALVLGRLVDRYSLEVLGPVLLVGSMVMAGLLYTMERTAGQPSPSGATPR